ncbi:hypothetical protein IW148_005374 [Coemansia sp. RSA 1199]|nr:hypothetical protein IW148_005374 [Coemansia sp. RSA 1199]
MATPDVAGTKTVLISLATGENGEIIPFVLTSNSNGLVPVASTVAEVQSAGWLDTDIQIITPSASPVDDVVSGDSAVDLESVENSDYVVLAESTDIESAEVENVDVENVDVENVDVESTDVESADVESADVESAEAESAEAVSAEEDVSPEEASIQDTSFGEASKLDGEVEYDSDADSDDNASKPPPQSSAHTLTATTLTISLCIAAVTLNFI